MTRRNRIKKKRKADLRLLAKILYLKKKGKNNKNHLEAKQTNEVSRENEPDQKVVAPLGRERRHRARAAPT